MKHFFTTLFLFALPFHLFAQTERVELTKEQMYEDFDQFFSIIQDVNPHLTLRKKVTGVDILSEISRSRQKIDTIPNTSFFIKLLVENLALCNDMHNCFVYNKETVFSLLNDDTIKIRKLKTLMNQVDTDLKELFSGIHMPFFLDYFKGDYYNIGKVGIETNGKTDTIPQGAKIVNIEGFIVDSLLTFDFNTPFRWDNRLKKKYRKVVAGELPLSQRDSVIIEYEINGETKKALYLNHISKWQLSNGIYFSFTRKDGYVDYFDNDRILYIRLPQMANSDYYVDQILEKGKDKKVEKVVIDIRQNGGGSDDVWRNILSAIIKDSIDMRADIGFKPTDLMFQKLEISRDSVRIKKIQALDNEEFAVVTWGKILEPDKNSLHYDGKIYVLQDHFIFSAAGSLSNLALMSDQIVSVGETTGFLLGFGIAPIPFALPNSYFAFQIEPVLDLSNADSLYDYYHDKVEIPVEISIEQRVKYFSNYRPDQQEGIYAKDFLYNHDPVFQKVLELK
ncbi:MAG: S41 family peptidase [Dysgonamonadaceae bacterium]|jgi:hypothetical protein|nr:S41 family peptidase [Dysgonamonadaceae bacterium]